MSNLEVTSQQETKSTPQKQPKYIYRAKIRKDDDSVFITYRNSNGKQVTYKPNGYNTFAEDAALLFNTVNKYFTGKNPNITPEEQVQLRADIANQKSGSSGFLSNGNERVYAGYNII